MTSKLKEEIEFYNSKDKEITKIPKIQIQKRIIIIKKAKLLQILMIIITDILIILDEISNILILINYILKIISEKKF